MTLCGWSYVRRITLEKAQALLAVEEDEDEEAGGSHEEPANAAAEPLASSRSRPDGARAKAGQPGGRSKGKAAAAAVPKLAPAAPTTAGVGAGKTHAAADKGKALTGAGGKGKGRSKAGQGAAGGAGGPGTNQTELDFPALSAFSESELDNAAAAADASDVQQGLDADTDTALNPDPTPISAAAAVKGKRSQGGIGSREGDMKAKTRGGRKGPAAQQQPAGEGGSGREPTNKQTRSSGPKQAIPGGGSGSSGRKAAAKPPTPSLRAHASEEAAVSEASPSQGTRHESAYPMSVSFLHGLSSGAAPTRSLRRVSARLPPGRSPFARHQAQAVPCSERSVL